MVGSYEFYTLKLLTGGSMQVEHALFHSRLGGGLSSHSSFLPFITYNRERQASSCGYKKFATLH